MAQIEIKYFADGRTEMDGVGFKPGKGCERMMNPIATALGAKKIEQEFKPEYHMEEQVGQQEHDS